MTLLDFKTYIKSFDEGSEFAFGISDPFSWRGSYDEVAFIVQPEPMSRYKILSKIEMAYAETFAGYKGGQFRYSDHTPIHFEESYGSYSGGDYCAEWIAKIEGSPAIKSQEERLVKLMFN